MNFNTLSNLAKVLGKKRLRVPNLILPNVNNKDRYNTFFHMLLQNEFDNEEDISEYFQFDGTKSKAYLKFKQRFIDKLITHVFLLHNSNVLKQTSTEKIKALYYAFIANILVMLSANTASHYYYKKALKIANKYNLYEIKINILRFLTHYSALNGKQRMFNKYKTDMFDTIEKLNVKHKTLLYFEDFRLLFSTKKMQTSASLKVVKSNLKIVNELNQKKEADVESKLACYEMHILYYNYINDLEKLKAEIKNAENLLEANQTFFTLPRKMNMALYNLELSKRSGKHNEAKNAIEKLNSLPFTNTLNWYIYNNEIIKYYLFVKEYKNAILLYNKVIKTSEFKSHVALEVELWYLLGAYLNLYSIVSGDETVSITVKPEKMDNEIWILRTDKAGLNVSFLLATVMTDFLNNNTDKLYAIRDKLSTYKYRYLKDKYFYRARIVVNTIIQLINTSFIKEEMKPIVSKARAKLATVPYWGAFDEVEIISFDTYLSYFLSEPKLSNKKTLNR